VFVRFKEFCCIFVFIARLHQCFTWKKMELLEHSDLIIVVNGWLTPCQTVMFFLSKQIASNAHEQGSYFLWVVVLLCTWFACDTQKQLKLAHLGSLLYLYNVLATLVSWTDFFLFYFVAIIFQKKFHDS